LVKLDTIPNKLTCKISQIFPVVTPLSLLQGHGGKERKKKENGDCPPKGSTPLTDGGRCFLKKLGRVKNNFKNQGIFFCGKLPENARHRMRQFCINSSIFSAHLLLVVPIIKHEVSGFKPLLLKFVKSIRQFCV